jgi:hypothetical protein
MQQFDCQRVLEPKAGDDPLSEIGVRNAQILDRGTRREAVFDLESW